MLIAFHKPFGVLSQFTPENPEDRTLAEFGLPRTIYPLGRLDADSEGLLLLSDEPGLNRRILHPSAGHPREYWAQVERWINDDALRELAAGVWIQGRKTLPCEAGRIEPAPEVPPRNPPIRSRKNVETCWIRLVLREGKNRQVRRMTAAVGHPTLRLIRVRVGGVTLDKLEAGQWKELAGDERRKLFSFETKNRPSI